MTRLDDARAELLSLQNIPDESVPQLWEPAYYGNWAIYEEARLKTFETISRNTQKNNSISTLSSEISQLENELKLRAEAREDLEIVLTNLGIKNIIPIVEIPPPPIIEDKPNITPNINDQLGNSLEPISTQIQKPENKGLILAAGLVAVAILLK